MKMFRTAHLLVASGIALCLVNIVLHAEEPNSPEQDEAFFNERIRPVLSARCWKCHGADKSEGGLRLNSREAILGGGDSGPALVPGKPEKSLLIQVIRRTGEVQMPPDGELPQSVVANFAEWIRRGAPWPVNGVESAESAAQRRPWSFAPLRVVEAPADDEGWSSHAVDRFLRAPQRAIGLTSVRPADKQTLIRRLTFNLTGLPPTPQDVAEFLADSAPDAWDRLMDRLLASGHYGEHWGRHWLDVVRYADTAGFEQDGVYRSAWRYRDYVIRTFNDDKPFDRFVHEQVAGDELWPDNTDAVAGTGLYCFGPMAEESVAVPNQLEYEWLTDSVDTTGAAFLGLTIGCARCHNHKYDPLTQRDYFALQAIFAASDRPYSDKVRERRIKALNGLLSDGPVPDKLKNDPRCLLQNEQQVGFKLFHRQQPLEIHRLHRGELSKPRELTEPAMPVSLAGDGAIERAEYSTTSATQRRAQLAKRLTETTRPLTARVIVNRVWAWHFGQGLVRTPNDFGNQGEKPTHPELLDWLADDLIAHGWSLKHLQRRILTSRTCQMQSMSDIANFKIDPENRLLAHFPRRRLAAEEIRDSMLACAGTLNLQSFGPAVVPPLDNQELSGLFGAKEKWPITKDVSQHSRRSVYLIARRTFAVPLLATFDLPETMSSCSRREQTVVPTQALALLNSPLSRQQAEAFAIHLLAESGHHSDETLANLWQIAFGRPATTEELQRSRQFLRDRIVAMQTDENRSETVSPESRALTELCLALFNSNEFLFVD